MLAPSLSPRRPVVFGVTGPLVAVIIALAGDARAQSAPTPQLPPPSSPAPIAPMASQQPPGVIEAAPLPPGALPAPGDPAAPGYGPAPAWGPPPGAPYWPPYAPAYPPSPSFYRTPEPFALPPAPPKEPANRKLMTAGIVASIGGVATLITGAVLMSVAKDRIDVYRDGPAYCCSIDDAPLRNAGIGLLVTGGIVATIGVPLWMIGGRRVPIHKPSMEKTEDSPAPKTPALRLPLLRVGAGAASLSWQF